MSFIDSHIHEVESQASSLVDTADEIKHKILACDIQHLHETVWHQSMSLQVQGLFSQAVHLFQKGNLDAAESLVGNVLLLQPRNFGALFLSGIISAKKGNLKKGIDLLLKAKRLEPNNADLNYNLANLLLMDDRHQMAIEFHKKSVQLNERNFWAHTNYGISLSKLGRFDEARTYFKNAITIDPKSAEGWMNFGNIAFETRKYEESLACYSRAIQLKPDHAEAWLNRGNAYGEIKNYHEAIEQYDQAIQLKPDYAEAWSNKGGVFHYLRRYEEALAHYDTAFKINPDTDYLLGNLVHAQLLVCSWKSLRENTSMLVESILNFHRLVNPFCLLSMNDSPHTQLVAAKAYVRKRFPENRALQDIPKVSHTKIRLGYFSPDFKVHPVSILMAELFELHSKDRFELFAFSFGSAGEADEMRAQLIPLFDHFIDVQNKNDREIAALARAYEIDIAVDLGGHTQGSRMGIFSYRAAPVQVNYLGYAGSTGAEYIDYIVADKIVIPKSEHKFYAEKVVYLPHSYLVDDSKREISDSNYLRSEFNLPETGFVFCCFNNGFKITPEYLSRWAGILQRVNDSVIWISAGDEIFQNNLLREFLDRGIASDRVVFAKRMPFQRDHLARLRLADLFLDTGPYNAHTTAMDALRCGLPVLTCRGATFSGRVAASLLSNLGLNELIVENLENYEFVATELANDQSKYKLIKEKLAANIVTKPLFNTRLFANYIETAYIEMYKRYQADLLPDHICISAAPVSFSLPQI